MSMSATQSESTTKESEPEVLEDTPEAYNKRREAAQAKLATEQPKA